MSVCFVYRETFNNFVVFVYMHRVRMIALVDPDFHCAAEHI